MLWLIILLTKTGLNYTMNSLSYEEKVVTEMLIQGASAQDIMDWLVLDYKQYKKIKLSILHKLHLKRIIQLLPYTLLWSKK